MAAILALSAALYSCKKEGSLELNQPGGPNNGSRLAEMVYKYDTDDSTVTRFQYDASGRLIGFTAPDGDPLLNDISALNISRNANGIIQSFVSTDALSGEQTTYTVNYDATRRQYTYRVANVDLNGTPVRDSTVFDYTNGRIAASRYLLRPQAGGTPAEITRLEFTYDGPGNLLKLVTSILNPQSLQLTPLLEVALEYDGKVNPLALGVEALVLDQLFTVSPANITKATTRELLTNTPPEESIATTYNYRADNRPVSATMIIEGDPIGIVYKYQ